MRKNIRLIEPNIAYEEQLLSYKQEFLDEGKLICGGGGLEESLDIPDYLKTVEIYKSKDTVPKDRVTSSTYMAITEDDHLVGIINIRHELNDYLLKIGGNIGYGIRKSERQKGYATEMLRLGLLKCKELGLEKALVTCNFDNVASEKTILSNGGVFENELFDEYDNTKVKRFWISL